MQKRWLDRPDSDTDFFERMVAFVADFVGRNIVLLAKVFPPLFGFAIFVLYFCRNGFYPSFDLFQFSSLLLAAACIGFVIVGLLVLLLFAPGVWIFHTFLNAKAIKEELRYARPYDSEKRGGWALSLLGLIYFLPYLVYGALLTAVILWEPSLFVTTLFLMPIPIALVFGITLQVVFDLKKFSFLTYLWAAYVAYLLIGGLVVFTLAQTYPVIRGLEGEVWQWLALIGIPLAIACLASLCSMLQIMSWHVALQFSIFFAVMIGGYSGMLTVLPEKTVSTLGLGNYEAQSIILAPEYCEGIAPEHLPFQADCALDSVHVIWSLGENLTLRLPDARQVQIPARFVRALVKRPE